MKVNQLVDAPIIHAGLHPGIGDNIQGPSLIRVPEWVVNPLGRYYLYFADHKGAYIRLAYADALEGPWEIYEPGSLQLADSCFPTESPTGTDEQIRQIRDFEKRVTWPHDMLLEVTTPHIASPDVHVDHGRQEIVMYFHGLESFARQVSRVATSTDGIHFKAQEEILGKTYLRVFQHDEAWYGLAMPGTLYRSADGRSGFEEGPTLFEPDMRHAALLKRDDLLAVFWTRVGEAPERIYVAEIDLKGDWKSWQESESVELLRPERDWEGANAPLEPSLRSVAYGHVNQLRDPCIFQEGEEDYLLYAVAGESGIAIARLTEFDL